MKISQRQNHVDWFRVMLIGIGIILVAGGISSLVYIHYLLNHITSPVLGLPTSDPVATTQQSTAKPATNTPYTVPALHPRQLIIRKLGIQANVLSMGVLPSGALDAPKTAWDVGWYNQSALPGIGYSALLIDGHVNNALNTPGVFYKIDSLHPGDTMQIQRGDDRLFNYTVVQVDEVSISQVDMSKMVESIVPGKEGLNLITCGGVYDYKLHTYNDRVLVFSVLSL